MHLCGVYDCTNRFQQLFEKTGHDSAILSLFILLIGSLDAKTYVVGFSSPSIPLKMNYDQNKF